MPYIHPITRIALDRYTEELINCLSERMESGVLIAGQLNYVISRIISRLVIKFGVKYSTLNEMIGVLECAKLEIYRRLAVPHENQAKERNGDVFDENA